MGIELVEKPVNKTHHLRMDRARYDGYKGRPIQPSWTDDQKAAWDEGRRARIVGPIEAVAKMIDKKADDFAQEHGHDDMGGLSFGRGQQADAKMDHHSTLVELAEEIRSIKLPDDMGYESIDMTGPVGAALTWLDSAIKCEAFEWDGDMREYARQSHADATLWMKKLGAVPNQTPIDMVLHCPKCGMQHIDKDNHDELRIEAAELGVDREGERELDRWIEAREWPNPPHRSHLCQNRKCGHIWRPADVPTNGVAAIKTAGTRDDPITSPQAAQPIACSYGDNGYACCEGGPCQADLHNDQLAPQAAQQAPAGPITSPSAEFQILKAEHSNLKSSYDRLRLAYDAWHEKTAWIHKTIKPTELGQHIADVMTARLQCLGDAPYTLTQYFEFEERIYDRMLRYYMASGDLTKVYPAWQVKVFECIRTKKLKKPWELTTKEYTFELARDIAKIIDEV